MWISLVSKNLFVDTRLTAAGQINNHKVLNMLSDPKKLVEKNKNLTHSELMTVISHVQREQGEWIVHTVMVEGCDVPFRFKRKGKYQSLKGARVNMTYYSVQEVVAGMNFEVMKVVRIKRG